jgi:hypothetical protein
MLLQRLDNTQFGSINVAKEKAVTAVAFRRPTKAWQDLIAQGGVHLRLLNLTGDAGVLEGAVPIVVDGKIIGGIGASGGSSQQVCPGFPGRRRCTEVKTDKITRTIGTVAEADPIAHGLGCQLLPMPPPKSHRDLIQYGLSRHRTGSINAWQPRFLPPWGGFF